MDQMKQALLKALGKKTLNHAEVVAAKANLDPCPVCGDPLTADHDGNTCRRQLAADAAGEQ